MTVLLTVLAFVAGSPNEEGRRLKQAVPIEALSPRIPPCNAACRRRRYWSQYTRPYRDWLRRTRACESDGIYTTNTGNGFYGAYQFTLQSWHAVSGQGFPHNAPPLEQDYRAIRLLHVQGRGAWPVCG